MATSNSMWVFNLLIKQFQYFNVLFVCFRLVDLIIRSFEQALVVRQGKYFSIVDSKVKFVIKIWRLVDSNWPKLFVYGNTRTNTRYLLRFNRKSVYQDSTIRYAIRANDYSQVGTIIFKYCIEPFSWVFKITHTSLVYCIKNDMANRLF